MKTQAKETPIPTKTYAPLNTLVQKIASSRPGAWFFSHTLHYLDGMVLKLTGERSTLTSLLTGLSVVMLTTTGARSGLMRTLPLLSIPHPQNPAFFAIIASNWGQIHYPAWYFNLKASPEAVCSIRGQTQRYVARVASTEEYEQIWQSAITAYSGYSAYKQRVGKRHIPILVMMPAQP